MRFIVDTRCFPTAATQKAHNQTPRRCLHRHRQQLPEFLDHFKASSADQAMSRATAQDAAKPLAVVSLMVWIVTSLAMVPCWLWAPQDGYLTVQNQIAGM